MTEKILQTVNYIVPAAGTTRGYAVEETFVPGVVKQIDFRQQGLDGQPFRPSGVFVDNTRGTDNLTIVINEIGFSIVVYPGEFVACQYPAPMSQSASIEGEGRAVLVFVDFPVIPFRITPPQGNAVTVADGADVALGAKADAPAFSSNDDATAISLLKGMLWYIDNFRSDFLGYDSTGGFLPWDFNSRPRSFTYDGNGNMQTEVVTKGANTWTRTYTYSGLNLTNISAWVKA